MKVYILWHEYEFADGREETKLIGVFSSETLAMQARDRLVSQPGFAAFPDGFEINERLVDRVDWSEGFISIEEAMHDPQSDLP